ncbi:hypothetical protein D3C71_1940850 [compost metagenome]
MRVGTSSRICWRSIISVRPPKCLLTSARWRKARTVASVCARVSWPRSEYMMLKSNSLDRFWNMRTDSA